MAKIKVHELATEVGKKNREIIEYLSGKGYDIKTAVNLVPEAEIEIIRAKFGAGPGAEAGAPAPAAKAEPAAKSREAAGTAGEGGDGADKPKKKGIIRVFRSQNASEQLQRRKKPAPPAQKRPAAAPAPAAPAAELGKEAAKTGPAAAPVKPEVREAKPAPEVRPAAPVREEPKAAPAAEKKEAAAAAPVSAPVREPEEKKEAPKAAPAVSEPEKKETAAAPARPDARQEAAAAPARPQEGARPAAGSAPRTGTAPLRNNAQQGAPARRSDGVSRGRDNQGYAGRDRGQGRGQDSRTGSSRPSYGQNRPQGDRTGSRPPYGQNRAQGDRTGSRPPYGQNRPQGDRTGSRPPYGQNRPQGERTGNRPFDRSGSRPSFGQGGARPAGRPASSGGDGALAHKTTRDFHKDGKERERNREEKREQGFGADGSRRPNQGRKQFNRVPKALQGKHNTGRTETVKEAVTEIRVPERITVRELAERMKLQAAALVKELFMKGQMVTVNHEITYEQAEELAMDHDIICEKEEKEDVIGELLKEEAESEETMVTRPPVVCVMGHVDHGKTSLLDAIRDTHVTDREAGGITQHIGAYMVSVKGQKITFLDTPGHEAFTAMRMRGANSTDIAVLVVAADDGVMPQTVEAINHAKAAGVEIIVAVNKIDKPSANVERVKQELSEYGLVAEDWGGETVFCPVSAKTREGIDNLLEMILLTSEMHELKANPDRNARGLVLEARLDKGRGPVASILIQKGTLHQGDFIACGAAYGKVRAMTDENGKRLQKATPSMPVEIIGLSSVPEAGEVLVALDSDREAKDFAAVFVNEGKKNLIEETKTQMSLDDLFNQIREGNLKELPIVVKADVQGSVEAVSQSLLKLSNEEVVVKVIHGGVGTITESDVTLASASNAIIIGFNVRPDATAKAIADTQKVDIHLYNVIYEAIEDVERALKGMRAAVYEEKIQGHAEIRQMFRASSIGNIAGAYIKDGIFTRSSKVRVFRKEEKIYEGELASLKRFKDDVKEVREGYECGFVFKDWGDFDVEDTVEAYIMVEVPRE